VLMEELKKGLKKKIRRKLIANKKSLTTVIEWFERSIKVDKCKRQVLVKEKLYGWVRIQGLIQKKV